MDAAVHLDPEDRPSGLTELRVEISPPTLTVETRLQARAREAVSPAERKELHLGQRLGATLQVVEQQPERAAVRHPAGHEEFGTKEVRAEPELLNAGDHRATRGADVASPDCSIDDGALATGDGQPVHQPDVVAGEPPGF